MHVYDTTTNTICIYIYVNIMYVVCIYIYIAEMIYASKASGEQVDLEASHNNRTAGHDTDSSHRRKPAHNTSEHPCT